MRSAKWEFTGLIGVAIALLVIDRMTRIQPMLSAGHQSLESFQMPVLWNGVPRQCGVGMASCPEPTKCGNGFCISTDPKPLIEKLSLPVLPPPPPTGMFQ